MPDSWTRSISFFSLRKSILFSGQYDTAQAVKPEGAAWLFQ
jgi:hypothetical protein